MLRLAHLRHILGCSLEDLWIPPASNQPAISCATIVDNLDLWQECQSGELVILATPVAINSELVDMLPRLVSRHIAGLLMATPDLKSDRRRLREMSSRHAVAIGLLGRQVDIASIANAVNRAAGAIPADARVVALHQISTLQVLADTLGSLIGNSVTIETPEHELLAFSAQGPVDRPREETILRRRGQATGIEWVVSEGYMDRVFHAEHPFRVPANPDIGFAGRTAMRVAVDEQVLAIIWAMDTERSLTDRDEAILEQAADAVAAILIQQREAAQREAELHSELLEDIVRGRISNPDHVATLAGNLGWDLSRPRQAMIVVIDDVEKFRVQYSGSTGFRWLSARERLTQVVRLETLSIDPEAIIAPRSTGVIILFAPPQGTEDARKRTSLLLADRIVKRVDMFIPSLTVTVGVGNDTVEWQHIGEAVRQAELAARIGTSLWHGNRATHYSDLGIYRTLFALQEHDEMLPPALQRLAEHDNAHGTDYVHTLRVYLACMGRLGPAASELNVHRNTLEYRMARLQAIGEVDLNDPQNRLALQLGIELLELRRTVSASG